MDVRIKGKSVYYKVTGSGDKTAVILQGWGTSCSLYDSVAKELSQRYRVVQFDFPGFGGSEEPDEPMNVDAFTDFFLELMKQLGIREAVLLGHSFGCRIIIKLAARQDPDFVIDRIVIIDGAGVRAPLSRRQKARQRRYRVMKKIVSVPLIYASFQDLIDDWRSRQGSADYRNATPMMKKCMVLAINEDLTGLFPRVQQDVLLVWGAEDTATPLSDGKKMEEGMPHAGLAVIEGAGHFSFLEKPAVFRKILGSYLLTGEA